MMWALITAKWLKRQISRSVRFTVSIIEFTILLLFSIGTLPVRGPSRRVVPGGRQMIIICPSPVMETFHLETASRSSYFVGTLNSGVLSESYAKIKPEAYWLIDPLFFQERPRPEVERILEQIRLLTTWELLIYVPWQYRASRAVKTLSRHPTIRIKSMFYAPSHFCSGRLRLLGLRLNLLTPVFQNVLIAALYEGLLSGFRTIHLVGAHHTWLRDVRVDDENRVFHTIRHTGQPVENVLLLDEGGCPKPYSLYVSQIAKMLLQYQVLRELADEIGAVIYNVTSDSFIEAFCRRPKIAGAHFNYH